MGEEQGTGCRPLSEQRAPAKLSPPFCLQRPAWVWASACAVSPTSSASRASSFTRCPRDLWHTWTDGSGRSRRPAVRGPPGSRRQELRAAADGFAGGPCRRTQPWPRASFLKCGRGPGPGSPGDLGSDAEASAPSPLNETLFDGVPGLARTERWEGLVSHRDGTGSRCNGDLRGGSEP